eukprot:TRINITY_DN3916_c0_g1_i1.p1 TRINITY_DN3916_c0_g1~~TRINITY_DN3916_c0_g1_i1.p1  ORF type:complete len:414 (+),score=127.32 TRINITY_DN3916_c0_g1_i1:121-1362(+)
MSAFPICVCSDLYETKVNLEVPFNSRPTMPELTQKIREVFDYEANTMKPPTAAPRTFQISRMQIYNDDLGKWEDLHRTEQLHPNCQVYCFQPNIIDSQADLPRVRQPKFPFQGAHNTSYAPPSPYQSGSYQQQPQHMQQQHHQQPYQSYAPSQAASHRHDIGHPICVCSDLYETKVNLEVPFNSRPTMPELTQKIREVFDYEANTMKPPTAAPRTFQISRMQIYNDDLGKWEDLHRTEQLHPNCQVYCFQPNIIDSQADLPRVRQPKFPFQGAHNTSYAPPSPYQSGSYQQQPQHMQQQHHQQPYQSYAPSQAASHRHDIGHSSRPHVDLEEKVRIGIKKENRLERQRDAKEAKYTEAEHPNATQPHQSEPSQAACNNRRERHGFWRNVFRKIQRMGCGNKASNTGKDKPSNA